MTALALTHSALDPKGPPAASQMARTLLATLARWEARGRTRADLRAMCPSRYGDVGLTRTEVLREVAKPFWRA